MEKNFKLNNKHPKLSASYFSKLFFGWMIQVHRKTIKNNLNVGDLYENLTGDRSDQLGDQLEMNWNNELFKAKYLERRPSLLRAVIKTFFWHYMIYGVLLFIQHVGLRSLQPLVLAHLISLFAANDNHPPSTEMYLYATLLVGISTLIIFLMHHCLYGQASLGMRIRIAVSSLIYRKTLRLNKRSIDQTTTGNIVNLLSNDVTRFDLVVLMLHYVWILPFQITLITYLIWKQIGIASIVGVVSIALLSLPVQGYLGKLTSTIRLKVAEKTDHRVTLMSEIIAGIQVIKMYAWEKPFEMVIKLARLKEVKSLTLASYLRGLYIGFMLFVERIALFLTTTTYVLLDNKLLAETVFSLVQFFNLLQLTMAVFFPMAISHGAESLVTLKRIQNFLVMEENLDTTMEISYDSGVSIRNVTAFWKINRITLNTINLEIPKGCLCIIAGPVGSGKSSLLNLLLGELSPDTGRVQLHGDISYASQEAWLFNSTIRANILFGQSYDRNRYRTVVKNCALEKDFEQLPRGDKTLVGERGTSLSGGQKARINLARAIYRDADIYLLDDPLSAVDTHVSKHIFEQCILKYLKKKTRILVTHQVQYLKRADRIVLLDDGKIEMQGTYEELQDRNVNFSQNIDEDLFEKENELEASEMKSSLVLSRSFILDSGNFHSDLEGSTSEETRVYGISPLKEYIRASGSYCKIFILLLFFIATQIVCSLSDYWITYWTQTENSKNLNATNNLNKQRSTIERIDYRDFDGSYGSYTFVKPLNTSFNNTQNQQLLDTKLSICIYGSLILAIVVIGMARSFFYFYMAMNSSKNLHNRMFASLLEAPMRFFNLNPSGRILNRFAKDIGAIDEILPKVLLESVQITFIMCGILMMVIISNIYMIAIVIVLGLVFIKIRYWFIKSSKCIKHLEGITKSPVLSHLNSSLYGLTTIRAFKAQEVLKCEFDEHQDVHTAAWSLTIGCMVSFGLWLDIVCVLFAACTTFSFIILSNFVKIDGSFVGLAISQALSLTGMLQYGIRQTAEVINYLTSIERILQYTTIEKEGPFETLPENRPPTNWPNRGRIDIKNLYLQYSLNTTPVLKDLNLVIKPNQKIGIVGRTGAGKSSLISALFRLTEIDGIILIDGVDISKLGLHDLRRRISIIPQDPVLFSATLRYNLDPFNEYTDRQIWQTLQDVGLKDSVYTLDTIVAYGGTNFSVGQRQLLCLARAILRNNKILILDEATANIDPTTDSVIQKTIRKKFKNCTVLTVAHRLNTIMDSDRVVVMENGRIVEFDHPYNLLQNPETIFYRMVLETGLSMSVQLEEIALHSFLHRLQYDEK